MDDQEESNEPMEVNNSDSDSSSSDDEEEQMLIAKTEELERQISDNKYLYNAHEELVTLYRRLGDLKSMRLAYDRFHEYFPLTPEIWLAWINDEKKLATSESDIKRVFDLFDKAVQDYISVNLWVEYAQYSIGASNLETTRAILERGLTSAGLHAAEGSLLWDTLRELEFAHLSLTPENTDQWKEQVHRIAQVFRRQLSVPLIGMESTYAEWAEWLKGLPEGHGVDPDPVEWGYKKALKTLETYKPFEDKLRATSDETKLLRTYKDYIKSLTDPSTVLCVYERAAARLCLVSSIWLDYCLYALRLGEAADGVSTRALRNCPWSEELWAMRLRVLEHLHRPESEVMSCFEQGMASVAGAAVELWLAYLEYVNRTTESKERLHKLFDQALEQLGHDEGGARVAKWYARLLAKSGDMPGARRLWKDLFKNPKNKGAASVWLEYAGLERQYGEPQQLRTVFQRALASCTDWPLYVAEEWMMFEREFGKLEDVLKCVEKRSELAQPPPAEEQKGKKRKLGEEGEAEVKKSRVQKTPVVKDPAKTVFVSNLYPSVNEKRLRKFFPDAVNVELVYDRKGKSRCYGYVQFGMEEEVLHALARDRELLDGRPIFVSNCKPNRSERESAFKYSSRVEENKLFVKGLPVEKTQEEVEGIFKPFGAKAVRLVVQKSGRSKGLAYVEFEDGESAKRAMKETDQMKIGEHTITVAISAPPPKREKPARATTPPRHARSKLQVPMIPRSLQVKNEKSGDSNGEVKNTAPKSNEDFRKMLLK